MWVQDITCGLRREGTIKCWGEHVSPPPLNYMTHSLYTHGALSSCPFAALPFFFLFRAFHLFLFHFPCRQVHPLWANNVFKQLAVGSSRRICGLGLTGQLRCWGKDERGQDVFIRQDGPFEQISTSGHRTCAIKVRCFCGGGGQGDGRSASVGWSVDACLVVWMCGCVVVQSSDRSLWCVEDDATAIVSRGGHMAWSEISVGSEHVCGVTDDADGALHCFAKHMTLFGDPTVTSPEDFATA